MNLWLQSDTLRRWSVLYTLSGWSPDPIVFALKNMFHHHDEESDDLHDFRDAVSEMAWSLVVHSTTKLRCFSGTILALLAESSGNCFDFSVLLLISKQAFEIFQLESLSESYHILGACMYDFSWCISFFLNVDNSYFDRSFHNLHYRSSSWQFDRDEDFTGSDHVVFGFRNIRSSQFRRGSIQSCDVTKNGWRDPRESLLPASLLPRREPASAATSRARYPNRGCETARTSDCVNPSHWFSGDQASWRSSFAQIVWTEFQIQFYSFWGRVSSDLSVYLWLYLGVLYKCFEPKVLDQ